MARKLDTDRAGPQTLAIHAGETPDPITGASAPNIAMTSTFATEGPLLQQLGMETIVMGPGSIDQAHQPNEYMALSQVQPAVDLLKQLIGRFCL